MFNQFFVNLFSLLIFYKLKEEIHTFAQKCIHFCALLLSPPTRVAWIETALPNPRLRKSRSPPTRVAWIETVSSSAGAVPSCRFATHTGGVDRNFPGVYLVNAVIVATHTGGVDRNPSAPNTPLVRPWSPPTRVAWIETSSVATTPVGVKRRHPHGWRG